MRESFSQPVSYLPCEIGLGSGSEYAKESWYMVWN